MTALKYDPVPRGQKVLSAAAYGMQNIVGYVDTDADGTEWRLVKAKTAITAPAGKTLVGTITGGALTYNVSLSNTAGSLLVVGIGDTRLSGNVAAGDLFWAQRTGDVEVKSATTLNNVGEMAQTITTTAGSIGELTLNAATGAVVNQARAIGRVVRVHSTTTVSTKIRLQNIL